MIKVINHYKSARDKIFPIEDIELDLPCSETKVEIVLDPDSVVFLDFERSPCGLCGQT